MRESVVARISETADQIERFDGPSDALLEHVVRRWWSEYGDRTAGGISKLMMAESSNFPEIARFFLEEVIEPWHELLATAIRRGIERGEFRKVDVEMNVHALAASLVMLSLWKCSFGPCSQKPVDAGGLHRCDDRHVRYILEARDVEGAATMRRSARIASRSATEHARPADRLSRCVAGRNGNGNEWEPVWTSRRRASTWSSSRCGHGTCSISPSSTCSSWSSARPSCRIRTAPLPSPTWRSR